MLHRDYDGQTCSIARTLEVVGERWSLLVLREALAGTRRFDDFQSKLGIARNVLQTRLTRLVDEGVLERRLYQERPQRYEYVLTPAGRDLLPVLIALMRWGDAHRAPDGPPTLIRHAGCGGDVTAAMTCGRCGLLWRRASSSSRLDRARSRRPERERNESGAGSRAPACARDPCHFSRPRNGRAGGGSARCDGGPALRGAGASRESGAGRRDPRSAERIGDRAPGVGVERGDDLAFALGHEDVVRGDRG